MHIRNLMILVLASASVLQGAEQNLVRKDSKSKIEEPKRQESPKKQEELKVEVEIDEDAIEIAKDEAAKQKPQTGHIHRSKMLRRLHMRAAQGGLSKLVRLSQEHRGRAQSISATINEPAKANQE